MPNRVEALNYATPGSPWVKIAAFNDAVAANIARLKLEAEDIPCVLEDENVGVAMLYAAPALGGIGLRVPKEYADSAIALLEETPDDPSRDSSPTAAQMAEAEAMPPELSGDEEEEPPARPAENCPGCGQRGEVYLWRRRLVLALLSLGVGTIAAAALSPIFGMLTAIVVLYMLLTKPQYLCPKCGRSWMEHDESA